MKNKYVCRSKISEDKFRKIIRYFVLDLDSHKIASLTSLNRNTVNRYLTRVRERIYTVCVRQSPFDQHPAAFLDDTTGTAPIFGLKEDGLQVRTDLIPVQSTARLRRCLRAHGDGRRLCLPERWSRYNGIVDMESKRLYGLGFAQKRMVQMRFSVMDHFDLHLKECEFRFNHRDEDIYQLLLKMLRERPLA